MEQLRSVVGLVNPLVMNELSQPSHLDESTFMLRLTISISHLFYFSMKMMCKQNGLRRDAAFCGVTSGAILYAYVIQELRGGRYRTCIW